MTFTVHIKCVKVKNCREMRKYIEIGQDRIFCDGGGFEKSRLGKGLKFRRRNLLAAGVLGDSLCTLRDGMLGELSWQVKPHSSLDFTTGDGVLLVVVS